MRAARQGNPLSESIARVRSAAPALGASAPATAPVTIAIAIAIATISFALSLLIARTVALSVAVALARPRSFAVVACRCKLFPLGRLSQRVGGIDVRTAYRSAYL